MPTEAAEQSSLYPELDMDNAEQKKLLAATKKLYQMRAERTQLLSTNKEKVDAQEAKVVELLHECGLEKFQYDNVEAALITKASKVDVKLTVDEDETNADDE